MSLRVPIADPTPCMRTFTPVVMRSCGHTVTPVVIRSYGHGQERFLSDQLRVAAMNRLEKLATLPLGQTRCGLPKRQSRVRRRLTAARVGYSPSRDPSAAWPGLSGGHRTASSFHEYVCSVTPIFLTDSATVLPRPTSTSTSRSIRDDLLGHFFLSAWH